jgi:hypothetical protein
MLTLIAVERIAPSCYFDIIARGFKTPVRSKNAPAFFVGGVVLGFV